MLTVQLSYFRTERLYMITHVSTVGPNARVDPRYNAIIDACFHVLYVDPVSEEIVLTVIRYTSHDESVKTILAAIGVDIRDALVEMVRG
jgi:hypothetical protein